jgi:hypothetical protein
MSLSRSRSTVRSRKPTLEALEDRQLLAVNPFFDAATGVLTLTGSAGGDGFQVVDSGQTTAGGQVQVFSGLNPFAVFATPIGTPVTRIVINTKGGNDAIVYRLTGSALGETRAVAVNLGAGNDAFTMLMANGLVAGTNWTVDVLGQAGNDALAATLAGQIAGALAVNFYGAGGRDSLSANYVGELDGSLGITLDGGADKDALASNDTLQAGSTGTFTAREFGRGGNDALALNIAKANAADPVTIDALIDGGGGTDTCSKSANVTAVNCP